MRGSVDGLVLRETATGESDKLLTVLTAEYGRILINAKGGAITMSLMPGYIIGMILAGITGFFALKLMLRLIMRKKYMGFAIYCFIFGVATLVISLVTK